MTGSVWTEERWHLHWAGATQFLVWLHFQPERVKACIIHDGRYWVVRYTYL